VDTATLGPKITKYFTVQAPYFSPSRMTRFRLSLLIAS